MAEATNRPGVNDPEAGLGTMPGTSPPEIYRPLSPPALAGFAMAVLYGAAVGISAVVALFIRRPLLMPLWLFLVPAVAVVLSWIGRNQIRASEGTRGGAGLASWGIGLSLVCSLLYSSYYAATYFAVRQQAGALAEQWIDLLRQGDVLRAYRLAIAPARRPPDDASLRENVEIEFNGERRGSDYMPWSNFRQSDLIRVLRGGEGVTIQPLGVTEWDYDQASYRVHIRYRITTPDVSGDAQVILTGSEAPAGEYEGRQWQVVAGGSGFFRETMKPTPRGEYHMQMSMVARGFLETWCRKNILDPEQGWLVTQPLSRHEAAARAFPDCRACSFPTLAGAAVLGTAKPSDADLIVARRAYEEGGLVRADPQVRTAATLPFWASRDRRDKIVRAVRQVFSSAPHHPRGRFQLAQTNWVPWEEKDGVVRLQLEGQLVVSDNSGTMPEYQVDVQLVLEAAIPADQAQPDWRLRAVELISGKAFQPGQGGPRVAPGAPRPPQGG
jgi:hypothetical protein